MSRQIQIRRGTAAEHANFTGAVGEVTMDTDAKTLRVHDGMTPGGTPLARLSDVSGGGLPNIDFGALETLAGQMAAADYVVEKSVAGANPWYRKYKSGWVEQGGRVTGSGNSSGNAIVFPAPMANTTYHKMAVVGSSSLTAETQAVKIASSSITTTGMTAIATWVSASTTGYTTSEIIWEVKGMAA